MYIQYFFGFQSACLADFKELSDLQKIFGTPEYKQYGRELKAMLMDAVEGKSE